MIAFYYTYAGMLGAHSLWVLVMCAVSRRRMQSGIPAPAPGLLCCAGAAVLCMLFFVFTFAPPALPLFHSA